MVFKYPNGTSKLHPTEKNHKLLRELILDNTNEGDMVFDPCMGSGSHLLVAAENGRNGKGVELNEHYFGIAKERLSPYTCSIIGSIIDRIRRIKDEQQSTGYAHTCCFIQQARNLPCNARKPESVSCSTESVSQDTDSKALEIAL
ncbi:MAG: site-specific DNA-methyltransferase [Clostridia bacterium]|nr:site-specific DNA-methyltransferase [Clostridia bacterium]